MNENNHARDGWYQPGALIYRDYDFLAASFTQNNSVSGTFYSCGLSLVYTPPVDVVAILYSKIAMSLNNLTNVTRGRSKIYDNTAATDLALGGFGLWSAGVYYYESLQTIPIELTGGVAKTFSVHVAQNGGANPNITIFGAVGAVEASNFSIIAFKKP